MRAEEFRIERTDSFGLWLDALRDSRARALVNKRLLRLARGNMGDIAGVGDGVSELRVHYGPGYRLYFTRRERRIILLLCGGDKSSQTRDIERAKAMAKEI